MTETKKKYEIELKVEDMRTGSTLMYAKKEIESENDYAEGDDLSGEFDYLYKEYELTHEGVTFSIGSKFIVEECMTPKDKPKRLLLETYAEYDDGVRPSVLRKKLLENGWRVTPEE
ncbi:MULTISPECIES: hypothetical protein [Gimesia]|uniref:hypothetical protein n=1 Tax=Gimesia TaxID=1649453 RepID=UPI000C6ADB0B|nr:hypothetical protein [Gimesia sp.]MAX39925.1 hypothetical protein [Gimesia sp.]|tara:strand:+ start:1112 stop:1459 length:348 start_codon:yes stop_codon:yes gene_type:complete